MSALIQRWYRVIPVRRPHEPLTSVRRSVTRPPPARPPRQQAALLTPDRALISCAFLSPCRPLPGRESGRPGRPAPG
jgi:hypothetical protein